jgi:hypothetical protein
MKSTAGQLGIPLPCLKRPLKVGLCNRPWLHVMCAICNCLLLHSLYLCLGPRSVLWRKGGLCRATSLFSGISGTGDRHRTGWSNGKGYDARKVRRCKSRYSQAGCLGLGLLTLKFNVIILTHTRWTSWQSSFHRSLDTYVCEIYVATNCPRWIYYPKLWMVPTDCLLGKQVKLLLKKCNNFSPSSKTWIL